MVREMVPFHLFSQNSQAMWNLWKEYGVDDTCCKLNNATEGRRNYQVLQDR